MEANAKQRAKIAALRGVQAAENAQALNEEPAYRSMFLPIKRGKSGKFSPAIPGLITETYEAMKRGMSPGDERDALQDAMTVAGAATLGSAAAPVSGGLRMGMGRRQTVIDPLRNEFSGIYKPAKEIAQEAAAKGTPPSPALPELFGGVTRQDLSDISDRVGNLNVLEHISGVPKKPKGDAVSSRIMIPENAERIRNVIGALRLEAPDLYAGGKGWYPMDPTYQRAVQLLGPEEGLRRFRRLMGTAAHESPNQSPDIELRRGAAANYALQQDEKLRAAGNEADMFNEWVMFGGLPAPARNAYGLLPWMKTVPGRVGNAPIARQQDLIGMEAGQGRMMGKSPAPKVIPYGLASGNPDTGFQTHFPVPDAHYARDIGLADVRPMGQGAKNKNDYKASLSLPEAMSTAPWFKSEVADPMGLTPVQSQGIIWTGFGPQTNVRAFGQPKQEIVADLIMKHARRTGKSPQQVRDEWIMGEGHLGANQAPIVLPSQKENDK